MENIESLLKQKNISYKSSGKNISVCCLNPLHNDKTPSMSINKETGQFYCFGCGIKGGYRSLYRLVVGENLVQDANTAWTYSVRPKKIRQEEVVDPEIQVLGNLYNPLDNAEIRQWLFDKGVEKDSFIKDYEITYSVYSEMIAKHVIDANPTEPWTKMDNRICIPIYRKGNLINYEGRSYLSENDLGEGRKVLYVKGGSSDYLFNYDKIDLEKDVIIVEGLKDFFRVWNVYHNTVAMFHCIPSDNQIKLLEKIQGDKIFFIDNDHGGLGTFEDGKLKLKGTLQVADEKMNQNFKYCFSKKKVFKRGKWKGASPGDCTLDEIETLVGKAVVYNADTFRYGNYFSKQITW